MTEREPVSVLLGVGTCVQCGDEYDEDGFCPRGHVAEQLCDDAPLAPTGRDHRGWLRK